MAGRNDRATICVVLVSHGGIDAELRSLLAERPGAGAPRRMIECEDAGLAMAELCLADRAERSRSAWGLDHAAAAQLLVVEPAERSDWPALRLALKHYLPRVELLSWSGGRLRALDEPGGPVEARLLAPPVPPVPRIAAPPPDAVVSGDEIAMLLERQAEDGT